MHQCSLRSLVGCNMAALKFLPLAIVLVAIAASVSGGYLDYLYPIIMQKYYNFASSRTGYFFNLEDPNGSSRNEMAVIMNPGTEEQEVIVMGTYITYDPKTDIETMTVYTADRNGYKPRVVLRKRGLSAKALKSATMG